MKWCTYQYLNSISTEKCIAYKVYDKGGITANRLIDFLENEVLKDLSGKVVILDNASSHRNAEVKEYILKNNNILYTQSTCNSFCVS